MDILFGKQVKNGTWIGSISLDASLSEVHSLSSEVTEHPVESGGTIADNVRKKPRMVRIEGFITNHPIDLPQSHVDGVSKVDKEFTWKADPDIPLVQIGGPGIIGAATGAIASAIGADLHSSSALGFEPDFDRVQDVLEELNAIWEERRVIDIVTTLQVYHNMVLGSLDITRDSRHASSMPFTAVASQITIVETALVPTPTPLVERGKPEKTRGTKPGTDPDSALSGAGKSVAADIADSLGGGF